MDVEIIDYNSTDVVDLTSGKAEPEDPKQEQEPEQSIATEPVEPVEESTVSTPVEDVDAESAATEPEKTDKEEPEDSGEEPEYFFNGEAVSVEVPEEVSNALKEAEIDEKALLSQLFKKDGDFSLDKETRTKLESKFGKTLVDGYLNMYKGMNEQSIKAAAADKEQKEVTSKQQAEEFMTTVGGEEGLVAMEDFILKNFDDKQIAAYNTVMESESHEQQLLIIQTVKAQMELSDKLQNGDKNIKLLGDDTSSTPTGTPLDKGYLTSDEFQTIMDSDKYWTDFEYQTKVDAARSAGLKRNL
ncbi:head scaffolding protein [Vibrio phage Vp670]|uniref:Scaffolding protein n=1 Tax=Vibrio phage Vp670 TaxID=1932890 RepID=A0A1L7DPY1_9CAUD|nr:head scaffolding protein [Vibrio phage Vp670]APU00181.1 scaffolding protein [Vibrio phage Vp670]